MIFVKAINLDLDSGAVNCKCLCRNLTGNAVDAVLMLSIVAE